MHKLTNDEIIRLHVYTNALLVADTQRHYRIGQAYFNALYILFPEVADVIRSTDIDPFYKDSKLPAFFLEITN